MVRTGASSPVAPPRKITTAAASGLGAMISSLRRVIRDAMRRPAEMRELTLDDPFRCDVSICQPGKCRDARLADSIRHQDFFCASCRRRPSTGCRTRSSPFRPARCGESGAARRCPRPAAERPARCESPKFATQISSLATATPIGPLMPVAAPRMTRFGWTLPEAVRANTRMELSPLFATKISLLASSTATPIGQSIWLSGPEIVRSGATSPLRVAVVDRQRRAARSGRARFR